MPETQDDFMRRIVGDALMKPFRFIIIDKPESEWNQEDLAYFARQTCGPHQALSNYGYHVLYMGQVDGEHRYQIKAGDELVVDVEASKLERTIKELVEKRREEENSKRQARIATKPIE